MLAALRSMDRRGASSALFCALGCGSSIRPRARALNLSPGRDRCRVTCRPRCFGENVSEPEDSESVLSKSSSASSLPVMPPRGDRTENGDMDDSDPDDSIDVRIGVIIGMDVVLCRGECRDRWDPWETLDANAEVLALPFTLVRPPRGTGRMGGVLRPWLRRRVRLFAARELAARRRSSSCSRRTPSAHPSTSRDLSADRSGCEREC